MNTIENLLKEVKIRFGENWETAKIDEGDYPFEAYSLTPFGDEVVVASSYIRNSLGLIFYSGSWATAKITEKPEKWVVEKDESHPMWKKCFYWLVDNVYRYNYRGEDSRYFGMQGHGDNLLAHNLSQYLTLDQWAKLFSDEPKEGDWCLFWDISTEMPVVDVLRYNTCTGFGTVDGSLWKNCQKLSPELTEMLTKEINQVKEK